MYEARIEKDSITQYGERLTTFVVTLPRIVLAELNTHKMLSKSSASSRAIPVEKMIARVREDPFFPVYWGKNQKGMQASQELTAVEIEQARKVWIHAAESAIGYAQALLGIGVHKQITNRLLEPFMWHTVIITGTDWSNFFNLRCDKEAQPEIREAAEMMAALMRSSRPKIHLPRDWHTPFIQEDEEWGSGPQRLNDEQRVKVSTGRAARVSYLNHDGKRDTLDDIKLADRVLASGHMAPWEHVARPMTAPERERFRRTHWVAKPNAAIVDSDVGHPWQSYGEVFYLGNFNGWVQARKMLHGEWDMKAFDRRSPE